jgi:hypothetical protein
VQNLFQNRDFFVDLDIDSKEMGVSPDWTQVPRDTAQWRAFVNTIWISGYMNGKEYPDQLKVY